MTTTEEAPSSEIAARHDIFSPCRELLEGLLRVLAGPQTGAGAEVGGGQQAGDGEAGAGGEGRLADDDGVGPEEAGSRAAGGDAEEGRGRHITRRAWMW